MVQLSICICSLPDRLTKLSGLARQLMNQAHGRPVEILYLGDNRARTTGYKRNDLKRLATGKHISFVDDDDIVSNDYVSSILGVLENSSPDVVTFNVSYVCKDYTRPVFYSIEYEKDANLPEHFERIPNHLMVIRREIANSVEYPDVTFGEDAAYAKRIKPLLMSEVKIPKFLYTYLDLK